MMIRYLLAVVLGAFTLSGQDNTARTVPSCEPYARIEWTASMAMVADRDLGIRESFVCRKPGFGHARRQPLRPWQPFQRSGPRTFRIKKGELS
jgi:hypothetical protein